MHELGGGRKCGSAGIAARVLQSKAKVRGKELDFVTLWDLVLLDGYT